MRRFILSSLLCVTVASAAGLVTFQLHDTEGRVHSTAELAGHKATVFVFLATDCPNSNSYAAELRRLDTDYKNRRVAFYSVYADPAETVAGIQKHDSEYAIPFPALLDQRQILARETGARVTPEAVVLSPAGKELYRGRIDDHFADFGKTRIAVDQHDLRVALDEILAGKAVSHPDVRSLGCAIPGVTE